MPGCLRWAGERVQASRWVWVQASRLIKDPQDLTLGIQVPSQSIDARRTRVTNSKHPRSSVPGRFISPSREKWITWPYHFWKGILAEVRNQVHHRCENHPCSTCCNFSGTSHPSTCPGPPQPARFYLSFARFSSPLRRQRRYKVRCPRSRICGQPGRPRRPKSSRGGWVEAPDCFDGCPG